MIFRTGIPDHEAIKMPETYDWLYSISGEKQEELPHNLPIPRGLPFMFGNNQSVITSSTIPCSSLKEDTMRFPTIESEKLLHQR
jgi:hypothetical protein